MHAQIKPQDTWKLEVMNSPPDGPSRVLVVGDASKELING